MSDNTNGETKKESLKRKLSVSDSSDDESSENEIDERKAFIKLSSYYYRDLRSLKCEIEDLILRRIKNLDPIEKAEFDNEKSVFYFKNFCLDKVGNQVRLGETGIAEGWPVPKYVNEFQNLMGLPFTEDHASLRIKKPRLECFNCLSINHRVQECPVRIDEERISIHRNLFATQSFQAQEQAQLLSNRYTSDLESKANRGFIPGKISNELREALGIKSNQLPPYIYIMRQYGYPIGWFMEARVKEAKLAVHDGIDVNKDNNNGVKKEKEEGMINSDDEQNGEKPNEELYLYDEDKIYSFEGFNEQPQSGTIDESDKFSVRRYNSEFSREKFLTTLKLQEKKKIVKRRSINKAGAQLSSDESSIEEIEGGEEENIEQKETKANDESIQEIQPVESNKNEGSDNEETNDPYCSPKKRSKANEEHGTSFIEILGTPIINTPYGTVETNNVNSVPNWEKFSESICAHKPFEMDAQTPTGSYKNIVKLTRQFKSSNQS